MSQSCFAGVLRTGPVSAIRAAMRRHIPPAISLQRIFPGMPCARLGPLRSAVARKGLHSRLAGGIFEYSFKNHPPIRYLSEVASTKRIPSANYSLSIALQENALRVMWLTGGTPRSAPG